MKLTYVNSSKYSNVKEVLKAKFSMSDRLLLKLKKLDRIYLNGDVTSVNHPVLENDLIECYLDYEEDNSNIIPTEMPLNIIYEDEAYIVVNKPAGIPVHPSMQHFEDSLSNGVKYYFDSIGLKRKIRPVNRLDRNTSGIVIFAKNAYIHDRLSNLMQANLFKKEYIAICEGFFEEKAGTINAPIARKENSIIERCVSPLGASAITHYNVLKEFSIDGHDMSEVHVVLETGRTHQIRVHMAYIGHPIVGDTLYGTKSDFIDRQALHAYKIEFVHPISGKLLCINYNWSG